MGWTLFFDIRFQRFVILFGHGPDGKSTVLDTWDGLLGSENVSHVPLDSFGGEFRLHEMAGKLANIAGDMGYVDKCAKGVLKLLTTGDPIQVNRKHKRPVSMRPTARLISRRTQVSRQLLIGLMGSGVG